MYFLLTLWKPPTIPRLKIDQKPSIVFVGLWFWLIGRCSMGRVAPFGLLLPVFAVMSSVLFLGDQMTPKLIAGGLLAISGVAMTQVRPGATTGHISKVVYPARRC